MPDKKNETAGEKPNRIRLQKFISMAGLASRRKAEEYIKLGSIKINGHTVTELGVTIDPEKDVITVEGETLRPKSLKYIILNKPQGVVSTREDPEHRPTVLHLLPDSGGIMYPVGRLDIDATGLVLMTNDGALAMAMTHPAFKTPRTYLVKVRGRPDEKTLTKLRKGVYLDDGKRTLPATVEIINRRDKQARVSENTWLKVIIKEGRNRQIKRMGLAVGHQVIKIERVAMGPIKMGNIAVGSWRYANKQEISELQKLAAESEKTRAEKKPRRRRMPAKNFPKRGAPKKPSR